MKYFKTVQKGKDFQGIQYAETINVLCGTQADCPDVTFTPCIQVRQHVMFC